jgi:hypothetical protein
MYVPIEPWELQSCSSGETRACKEVAKRPAGEIPEEIPAPWLVPPKRRCSQKTTIGSHVPLSTGVSVEKEKPSSRGSPIADEWEALIIDGRATMDA